MTQTPDIGLELSLARNLFGPLDDDVRRRLLAVVARPNRRTWEKAHGIILSNDPMITLWQAVCELDRSFCFIGPSTDQHGKLVSDWKKIPGRDLLVRAIRYATH